MFYIHLWILFLLIVKKINRSMIFVGINCRFKGIQNNKNEFAVNDRKSYNNAFEYQKLNITF